MDKTGEFKLIVVGAGPAGLTAALLLARSGHRVLCLARPGSISVPKDPRTTALMQGAVRLLDHLDVWSVLEPECAPLQRLRLIDDTDWTVKAPTVLFDAAELGEQPFGWNIPNQSLLSSLISSTENEAGLLLVEADASRVVPGADLVTVETGDGRQYSAPLVVAADGRDSICRKAAGIRTSTWSYPQTAIACSFSHSLPHEETSTEYHKPAGPLTLVPLPGNRSSLVWVAKPQDAEEIAELPPDEFEVRLTEETHGILGTVSETSGRGAFAIKGLTPRKFALNRIALIGEAAHVLPPIGAQGLNLGLRDAALIAELSGNALEDGRDCGSPDVLDAYDRRRRLDVLPRTAVVDFLNRSLFSGMMPLQGLRGLGLFMLDTVGPLRRAVMRQGMEPQTNLPLVMQ